MRHPGVLGECPKILTEMEYFAAKMKQCTFYLQRQKENSTTLLRM